MIERKEIANEKTILIGTVKPGETDELIEEHLSELELLAETAGAEVIGKITQRISKINSAKNQSLKIIDLYRDSYNRPRTKLIKKYQDLVTWSDRIYIISPVWWFSLTPRLEFFFNEVSIHLKI